MSNTKFKETTNYFEAIKWCKSGCLITLDRCYVVNNETWDKTQYNMLQKTTNYTIDEKDQIMKMNLFNKMKEKNFSIVKINT
jgi:hypothetical protein